MKKKLIVLLLFSSILLLYSFKLNEYTIEANIISNEELIHLYDNYTIDGLIKKQDCDRAYKNTYEEVINYIKYHEKFVNHRYHTGIDTDKTSIGYGHVIKPIDIIPDTISEHFADSLLRRDYDRSMWWAKKTSTKLKEPKNKYQLLAISHFIFAKGIGNYQRSTLRKRVENNQDISTEIKKWIVMRINGEIQYRTKTLKYREFEIRIYNLTDSIRC